MVDAADYAPLVEHINGDPSAEEDLAMRKKLAWKAYQHCASYDSVVAEYLWSEIGDGAPAPELSVPMTLMDTLRYGENPHQPAAVYADASLAESEGSGVGARRCITARRCRTTTTWTRRRRTRASATSRPRTRRASS